MNSYKKQEQNTNITFKDINSLAKCKSLLPCSDKLESEKLKIIIDKIINDNDRLVVLYKHGDRAVALKSLIVATVKASKGHTSPKDARVALLEVLSKQ